MFLSKVTLNTRHRTTYNLLADLYAQHRFVMSAFPDLRGSERQSEGSQSQQGVLYRLDTMKQSDEIFFLVQSMVAPEWGKAEALHRATICSAVFREWNPTFMQGARYRFRLRANPSVCRVNRDEAGKRNPKREGLFTEEAQRDWLIRTAERCGFGVQSEAVVITPKGKLEGAMPQNEGKRQTNMVTCFTVDFDGALFVKDAERFAVSLREGVGRGKAWGCGLLSLARA
jgi:CRISPR system Cascade subunit CasE